jgi:hypothetical protein
MGLDLSDAELAAAATACRALAFQEELRARAIVNPAVRAPILAAAERYAALAIKIEAGRQRQERSGIATPA